MIMIQMDAKTSNFDAELSPIPNQMMNKGSNASGGIGRSSFTAVSKKPRARLESPMARPIGTPKATPPAIPLATHRRLANVCSQIDWFRYPSSSQVLRPLHVELNDGNVRPLMIGSDPVVKMNQAKMIANEAMRLDKPELRTAAASPNVTVLRALCSSPDLTIRVIQLMRPSVFVSRTCGSKLGIVYTSPAMMCSSISRIRESTS
jgi:hypothetical protein